MLGADARDLLGVRGNESRPTRALAHGLESRPADTRTPQRRGASIQHHRRSVAGAIEIDRLEILVLLQSQAVEQIARQDRKAGALCTERDPLPDPIPDPLLRTLLPH